MNTEVEQSANDLTLRGIALLNTQQTAALREAISFFDQAIHLRQTLPLDALPWSRYGFIAGWMNRGDALTRLGSPAELTDAVRSFDRALAELRLLPLDMSPLFRQRLAIAWLNRGIASQQQGTHAALQEALRSFEQCAIAAEHAAVRQLPEGRELLAAAATNRSNTLLQLPVPRPLEARAGVREVLAGLRDGEQSNVRLAEIGLRSRHVLCRSLALLLTKPGSAGDSNQWLDEATEAVEQGLALVSHWESRGVSSFAPMRLDLFRFGARVYQTYQPQFLTEFLLEQVDSRSNAAAMHAAALEALWRAAADVPARGGLAVNSQRFDELLRELADLRVTEEKLDSLRRRSAFH
ncbi:MAG TPA: hypothetical protein VEH04_11835 [Verrucomicrobiae bacterium]|nr:hypothetical protein [Verrucomicrobiae bacterium]